MQLARHAPGEIRVSTGKSQCGRQTACDFQRKTGPRQRAAQHRRRQFGSGNFVWQLRRLTLKTFAQPEHRHSMTRSENMPQSRAQPGRWCRDQHQLATGQRLSGLRGDLERCRECNVGQITRIDTPCLQGIGECRVTCPQGNRMARRQTDTDRRAPGAGAEHRKLHKPQTCVVRR